MTVCDAAGRAARSAATQRTCSTSPLDQRAVADAPSRLGREQAGGEAQASDRHAEPLRCHAASSTRAPARRHCGSRCRCPASNDCRRCSPRSAVRAVSAVTIATAPAATTNSSAATWISAVLMPWPSSALPVKTVTRPLGVDADPGVEQGRLSGCRATWRRAARLPCGRKPSRREREGDDQCAAAADDAARGPGRPAEASSWRGCAHDRTRRARRRGARRAGCASGYRSGRGWAPCGARISASLGFGVRLEQRLRAHDHAGDAVAALRGLLLDEGALHDARRLGAAEPFDGSDRPRRTHRDRHQAGEHGLAIDHARCRRRTGRGRSRTSRRSAPSRRAARRAAASPGRRRRGGSGR